MPGTDKKTKKRKIITIVLFAAVLLNIVLNLTGNALQTERYTLTTDKLTRSVRVVFISDLHNCTYGGKDQSQLMDAIREESPDIVLFGGDVVDDYWESTENAMRLMKTIQEEYPCAYASGNHEVRRKDTEEFYAAVASLGIQVLHGEYTDITVNGQTLRISGLINAYNYPQQLTSCLAAPDGEKYSILLLHHPEQFDYILSESEGLEHRFDLILSGHAHGGQWRIPGLLEQGLFAPDQGLFPEFTCGQREMNGTVQIVSRGLAKPFRMILIPRIFNRPELSVIDIIPQT